MKQNQVNIIVPADWDAKQDLAYYHSIHGDDQDRIDWMLSRIESNFKKLERVVSCGARFLMAVNGMSRLAMQGVPLLGFRTRVELFRSLVHQIQDPPAPEYSVRFDEDLDQCLAVEQLRNEIMEKYVRNHEAALLYELVNLDDWIMTVYLALDESLECEHDEYQALFTGRFSDVYER